VECLDVGWAWEVDGYRELVFGGCNGDYDHFNGGGEYKQREEFGCYWAEQGRY